MTCFSITVIKVFSHKKIQIQTFLCTVVHISQKEEIFWGTPSFSAPFSIFLTYCIYYVCKIKKKSINMGSDLRHFFMSFHWSHMQHRAESQAKRVIFQQIVTWVWCSEARVLPGEHPRSCCLQLPDPAQCCKNIHSVHLNLQVIVGSHPFWNGL